MYTNYFGFNEKPFTLTPNPRFIFLSKNHKEAFAHLLYGINNHYGFIELIGEVGTGKTTVLRTLLGQLQEENYRTALIFNPCLSGTELLRTISHEFGLEAKSDYTNELLADLNRFLLAETAGGKTVVLVIDEAQNLQPDVLEQIRLISNLETDNDKLIQIILAGQPELATLLERPDLRQLNQRIAVRYRLKSMSMAETRDYIRHRMEIAGESGGVSFTDSAVKWIHLYTRGVPRMINILCDRSLLIAYGDERRNITAGIVSRGIREILNLPHHKRQRTMLVAALVSIVIAFVAWKLFYPIKAPIAAPVSPPPKAQQVAPLPIPAPQNNVAATAPKNNTTATSNALQQEIYMYNQQYVHIHVFNVLAEMWGERQAKIVKKPLTIPDMYQKLAKTRNLNISEFQGPLDTALAFNLPMLAVTRVLGELGNYSLAITGRNQNILSVAPSLFSRNTINKDDLKPVLKGQFYLVWKNIGKIPFHLRPGERRFEIMSLQRLLQQAGVYREQIDGVYNPATVTAVRSYQRQNGIPDDAGLGELTVALLSRHQIQQTTPTLTRGGR